MLLRLKDLNQFQRGILFAPFLFIFWPLLHFDWRPIDEVQIDRDSLIHHLYERSLELPGSCSFQPSRLSSNFLSEYNKNRLNQTDEQLEEELEIEEGGRFVPSNCTSVQKVAIVISYRDRSDQLHTLVPYLHRFLHDQQSEYQIFVVEQNDRRLFNKGLLYNAAFNEIAKQNHFNCYIFHDVDLLPENQLNLYACADVPLHLSVRVSSLRYVLPYKRLIGGVLAIRPAHYRLVNGFSNRFVGWGGEDDNLFERFQAKGLSVMRCESIGIYTMVPHQHAVIEADRQEMVLQPLSDMQIDGINSANYHVFSITKLPLYTHLLININ